MTNFPELRNSYFCAQEPEPAIANRSSIPGMKFIARLGLELVVLMVISFVARPCAAQAIPPVSPRPGEPAAISHVKILLEKNSPVLEIISTRPVTPTITKPQDGQRIVIDLLNTNMSVRQKRINVQSEDISVVHLQQYKMNPPIVRITVGLLKPHSYTWDAAGNRLLIRLHAEGEEVIAKPPSVPSLTRGVEPVAVPVSAASSGALLAADRLASGLSLAAAVNTTVLRLTRGGEVHVCPGTTVSLIHSQKGPDLMLSMGTGTLETHYELDDSADSILTPDFRILLRGPGEFHFGISADSQGNVCVRTLPGDTGSAIISELVGDNTYKVEPGEMLVLGRLSGANQPGPDACGCKTPRQPVLRAALPPATVIPESALSASLRLAQPGDEAKPTIAQPEAATLPSQAKLSEMASLPAPQPNRARVQVDAPLVYPPPAEAGTAPVQIAKARNLPLGDSVRAPLFPTEVLPPDPPQAEPHKRRRGVFGTIRGIFAKMFR